ncbi:N-glycosidase YbiA-like [Lytechinus pictus]|uniref:N-glycosidase YbiA-like n=1 Tax=Lytechinus pictus TaxID=7653 RepID=UPI00240DFF2D|nr:N-glycosidase YbiA-like [Lytechinus pictus]
MAMASNSETEEKYTFFYGEKSSPFSQFRAANFVVDGVQYTCAEMYMMHQKAVLFGDHEIAEQILVATKPMAMKALGRKVRNFDEEVWKQHRRQIVKKGNLAKFSQNLDILAKLLETRGTTLVEASPRDRIWGIGMGKDNPNAKNKNKWRGQNLLGYILTEVREELSHAG